MTQNKVSANLRYHCLHLENTFLNRHLQSHDESADQQVLLKRQSRLHRLIREIEKSPDFHAGWRRENVAQLQADARAVLIDDLAAELKSAVTNELYMQHLLYDHGHSKTIFFELEFD